MVRRKTLGDLLRIWRQYNGLSQEEAAAGVTDQPTWSKWERGVQTPDLTAAAAIVTRTNGEITADDILGSVPVKKAG